MVFTLLHALKILNQHLMVMAAKASFDLHIPSESLLAGEYEVQQSTFPQWLLYESEED